MRYRPLLIALVLVALTCLALHDADARDEARPAAQPIARPVARPFPIQQPKLDDDARAKIAFTKQNLADAVVIATVTNISQMMATRSMPPTYGMTVAFDKKTAEFLRKGDLPLDSLRYMTRDQGSFPKQGDRFIVAAVTAGENWSISSLTKADDKAIERARLAVSIPVGWSLDDKAKPVSPWARLHEKAWPKELKIDDAADVRCAKSRRPALMCGKDIQLKVERVEPKEKIKFQNPYGDGEFTITVTNAGQQQATVNALLAETDGKTQKILWADSLIIMSNNTAHLLPDAGRLSKTCKPLVLKPGQSVSTTINTLLLDDINWPRGGSRVPFRFCLGEQSAESFMYYYSKRHDKLREQAKKEKDKNKG